jgi:hypothetical protein
VISPELTGHSSLLSSAKAERMLGFAAEHTWESYS